MGRESDPKQTEKEVLIERQRGITEKEKEDYLERDVEARITSRNAHFKFNLLESQSQNYIYNKSLYMTISNVFSSETFLDHLTKIAHPFTLILYSSCAYFQKLSNLSTYMFIPSLLQNVRG